MGMYATTAEILEAFEKLSNDELLGLRYCAKRLIDNTAYTEPLDLLHEALARSLDGRRNWPPAIDFAVYLAMTMRSVANAERKSSRTKLSTPLEDAMELYSESMPHSRSAEDVAISREEFNIATQVAEQARASLRDDPDAQRVLSGLLSGMSPREMCESFRIDTKTFDAARHRVMRRIQKEGRLH